VASINCARVVIVTVDWFMPASFKFHVTTVNGTNVVVVTILQVQSIFTTANNITFISGTSVVIVTRNVFMEDFSGSSITPITGTCVFVITIYRSKNTSTLFRNTSINSAWIFVITNNFVDDNSNFRSTRNG